LCLWEVSVVIHSLYAWVLVDLRGLIVGPFCGSFYFVISTPTDERAGSVLCWVPEPVVRWFIVAVESMYGVHS